MKQITEQQFNSLADIIYETLIQMPDMGMGEMGECRDTAESIINEWAEKEGIEII